MAFLKNLPIFIEHLDFIEFKRLNSTTM